MSELKFGIHYSCQSPEREWEAIYQETLRQAREAEQLGYSSLSVAEHHFLPDGWIPTPSVLLGAFAAVTKNMRLISNLIVLPLHHPVDVAEQASVLDLLCGGKLRLGVGIGWRDEEFDAFGVDKRQRVRRVEEGIQIIRKLLSEESVTFSGDVFSVENLSLMPRSIQQPVPIWYGGQSRPAVDRAARMADAWSMSPIESRNELAAKVADYRDDLEKYGRSFDEVEKPLRREMYIAEDDEMAWEEVGEALLYEYEDVYGEYDDIGHTFSPENREQVIEELREHAQNRFIIGGPETAIEELERYREEVEMDEVILRMHFPGLDPAKAEKSMRIVAEDVMPHFHG